MEISAFGVDHGLIEKGLIYEWRKSRDLKRRQKFSDRYKGGDGKAVRTKHLRQIKFPGNPTQEKKVKALTKDIKQNGMKRNVRVGISRTDPNKTYITDGHHRTEAHHRLGRRYTQTNIEINENRPFFHTMNTVWPEKKPVHKSFKKLQPKLLAAKYQAGPQNLDTRIRENYAQFREQAGSTSPRSRKFRVMDKEGAEAMVTAAGNRSRRKGRKLP